MMRLKELRNKMKISQNQFAKDIGVAQNTVSNWENENRLIDTEMLTKISDYFNVTTDYLLGRENEQKENPTVINDNEVLKLLQEPMNVKFLDVFTSLSPAQQQKILDDMDWLIENRH